MQIVVPEYALASGSLQVCPKNNQFNQQEAFLLLQKIAAVWKEQGVVDYLIYRKSDELSWEIVPYYQNHSVWDRFNSIIRQLFVLACVSFDRCFVRNREIVFAKYKDQFSSPLPPRCILQSRNCRTSMCSLRPIYQCPLQLCSHQCRQRSAPFLARSKNAPRRVQRLNSRRVCRGGSAHRKTLLYF